MAVAVVAKCLVIFNNGHRAVKCVSTKKAMEKALLEVGKMPGYTAREVPKGKCPVCNPPPPEEEEEAYTAFVTMHEEEEDRPGQCHQCKGSRHGMYRLIISNGVLVRKCKDCGAEFDCDTLKPREATIL